MLYDKEILKLKRKISSLEAKAAKAKERRKSIALRKVTVLLKKLGYSNLAALTADVGGSKVDPVATVRKRAIITASIRKDVVADLRTGKSAAVIAKKHGISLPSVNNIKKAAGLTKSRKAKKVVAKRVPKKVAKPATKSKKKTTKAGEPALVGEPAGNASQSYIE